MKEINLNRLKLKTFIKQDVLDYCLLNNINPNNITELYLSDNQLTDITGIKLFKNLKDLYLWRNNITDISILKDLNKLEYLWLDNNKINMNRIDLKSLELKTFTEQNAKDYCHLKDINIQNIISLDLNDNRLTDISGIKIFENLQYLDLGINKFKDISVIKYLNNLKILNISYNNEIKDISVLKYLINLEDLNISRLELESDQIQHIESLKNLKYLWGLKGFKDISVLKQLNKNIKII